MTRFSQALVIAMLAAVPMVRADVVTVPTTDPAALTAGLPSNGLTVVSMRIRNGQPGQFGTFTGFSLPPVTIRDGIVLSSGNVAQIGPMMEVQDPNYDPASPPPQVSSVMTPDPDQSGGTSEFDVYGDAHNHIQNFQQSFDVASLEVVFDLAEDSQVQFDFVFGSVEFPFYTSGFTDAFLVFLDGTREQDQICFDTNGDPVQVGSSFAGLETTADVNTAFANPHALIHHLTTTTDRLDAGRHTLIFEVGDVNDHILDSVAFITNLRTGVGTPGTDPSDDCRADADSDGVLSVNDIFYFLNDWFEQSPDANFNGGGFDITDIFDFLNAWFAGC